MKVPTTQPARAPTSTPTIRGAGHMGSQAVRRAGRTVVYRLVLRGGGLLARLNRIRPGHAMLVVGIYVLIPFLFDPEAAGDLDDHFELRIRNPRGGDPEAAAIVVSEGKCRVVLGPYRPARVVVTAGADDIVRMASGEIGWPQLVSAGRLVLWGDPYLALRFPLLFGLPPGPDKPAFLNLLPSRRPRAER
ncbi:MAG TPA: SCP2 sterol-binding domain-containing protein [Solirubrobacteraceae bacterium]|jgi:hypothetical protein|nr:SCP2 sterol-binding domain-containing protein [Solirubrobacteraceae bacterium]